MKLFVGLGNPGKKYSQTRHNVGFLVMDKLANNLGITITTKKFDAFIGETKIKGEKVILMKPQTFMNLSGWPIKKALDFYNLEIEDLIVVYDDIDLPLGKLRLRYQGSAAGHNGVKDIINHLHTNEFKRIRVGVDNTQQIETKDYVLGKFSTTEQPIMDKAIAEAASALEDSVNYTFVDLMSKYNN